MKKFFIKILPNWLVTFIKIKQKTKTLGKQSTKEIFTVIKNDQFWGSTESVSGVGSELEVTAVLRLELQKMFAEWKIRSILDIPSGDFNWMKAMDLSNINYIGGDIVASLVQENNNRFGSDNIIFKELDLVKDPLPKVDLIFCRDCLVHLSNKEIYQALKNIKNSQSKYLLVTSFVNAKENNDIITGSWRKLNFEIFPFYFKSPLYVIDEKYTGKDSKYADKSMCLWKVSDIKISNKLKLYYWFS